MFLDVFDPIRYREVSIQYEMQIKSQHTCQLSSQLHFSYKRCPKRRVLWWNPTSISNFPKCAMEAPLKPKKGMLGTIEFILGPIRECFLP